MEVIFLQEAARGFLCSWQSLSHAGSENKRAAKTIKVVLNIFVMTYLRREKNV